MRFSSATAARRTTVTPAQHQGPLLGGYLSYDLGGLPALGGQEASFANGGLLTGAPQAFGPS
jgi:hypothetical protein